MWRDSKDRPGIAYLDTDGFATPFNSDRTEGYACAPGCGRESLELYVWQRKRNVDTDRLIWTKNPQNAVLYVRDPLQRIISAWHRHRDTEARGYNPLQFIPPPNRYADKPNLADSKEFTDSILSTVAGKPEFCDRSTIPFTALYEDPVYGQLVNEYRDLGDVAIQLPGFPHINASVNDEPFDDTYRWSELAAYYADDLKVWNEVNAT